MDRRRQEYGACWGLGGVGGRVTGLVEQVSWVPMGGEHGHSKELAAEHRRSLQNRVGREMLGVMVGKGQRETRWTLVEKSAKMAEGKKGI